MPKDALWAEENVLWDRMKNRDKAEGITKSKCIMLENGNNVLSGALGKHSKSHR